MTDGIRISSLDDVVEWKNAMLCLGVERSQPLYHSAGVPRRMASLPGVLRDVAIQFLLRAAAIAAATRNLPADQPVAMRAELLTEPYAAGIEGLLADAFDDLAAEYGDAEAGELREWAERHFVDPRGRNRWWLLSLLLPRLASAFEAGGTSQASPLAAGHREAFVASVHGWFGSAIAALDAGRIASARAIPLSAVEQRLVALEVLEPEDPPEVDVVNALELALGEERAYRAWQEIRQIFAPPQQRQIVEQLAVEAGAMNVPANLVDQLITPLANA